MGSESPIILLLENDTSDIFTFRRALSRLDFPGTVRVVNSVMDAISYLQHTGTYHDPRYSPRPDLIVCDLKLCASTGTELLQWMREQEDFRKIPVVMLSGSALPGDVEKARSLGACGFFLKSGDMDEVTERIRELLETHLLHTDRLASPPGGTAVLNRFPKPEP